MDYIQALYLKLNVLCIMGILLSLGQCYHYTEKAADSFIYSVSLSVMIDYEDFLL